MIGFVGKVCRKHVFFSQEIHWRVLYFFLSSNSGTSVAIRQISAMQHIVGLVMLPNGFLDKSSAATRDNIDQEVSTAKPLSC